MSEKESEDLNEAEKPAGESISWDGLTIPIVRAGMPDMFLALNPPSAEPYMMVPKQATPEAITNFFSEQIPKLPELRQEMIKRYEKSPSRKCHYQTGDVAYVMGRPFQLRVFPLATGSRKMKSGARGRVTSKYAVDSAVSLLLLYVVNPKVFDEAKVAFNGFAESVLLRNGEGLTADFAKFLLPDQKVPPVRMRAMRGRWASSEAGALWLSTDLIPYPPDCLVYVIWKELEKKSNLDPEVIEKRFEEVLPGWRQAQHLLATRPEPYNLQ